MCLKVLNCRGLPMVTNKLTTTDLTLVLSRVPRDVRELLIKHKLFLAGGFIRATIAGETPSDIDLLGPDKIKLLEMGLALALERGAKTHSTDNALTIISPPRLPVQFITRWLVDSAEQLIAQFDFTVVQACIWFDQESKTWQSVCNKDFYADLAARRLVYTSPKRHEDAGGSMLRVIKYIQRGYIIQAPSLARVMSRMVAAINVARMELRVEGDNKYLSEAVAGLALLMLLREVDPLAIVDGVEFLDDTGLVETGVDDLSETSI